MTGVFDECGGGMTRDELKLRLLPRLVELAYVALECVDYMPDHEEDSLRILLMTMEDSQPEDRIDLHTYEAFYDVLSPDYWDPYTHGEREGIIIRATGGFDD